jgi:hypothetical protein
MAQRTRLARVVRSAGPRRRHSVPQVLSGDAEAVFDKSERLRGRAKQLEDLLGVILPFPLERRSGREEPRPPPAPTARTDGTGPHPDRSGNANRTYPAVERSDYRPVPRGSHCDGARD